MTSSYDSYSETSNHIARVKCLISIFSKLLAQQGEVHDKSKLEDPEKALFDVMTPKLKGCTYGSPEYQGFLKELDVALKHHYAENTHHPEHFENGFAGMTLVDVVECFLDWKSASERHADGDLQKSIEINSKRFKMDPQLVAIFDNTRKLFDK